MIEIEGPDGVVYEFPEGTDDATMARAMQQVYRGQPQEDRGLLDALYDNVIGDSADGVQSYGEQLGTWLNRAGESMTLGTVGDEASAAAYGMLPGRSYDTEVQRFRDNEANMSTAGRFTADLAGALIPGLGMGSAIMRGGNLATKAGLGLAAGGTAGGIQGFMEGEGDAASRWDNATGGAGIGALAGGAIPLAGSVVGALARGMGHRKAIRQAAKGAPSSAELRAMGNALYRQIDEANVQIRPEAFDRARASILDNLRASTGFDELPGPGSLTPNTGRVMEIMDQAAGRMAQEPTAALPFRSLDQMRRQAGAAAGNVANKTDQQAGMEVISGLDDFVQRLGADDVVSGDPAVLQSAIGKAREIWSRMSRSQLVDDAMEKSQNYLSGTSSGIRNQFKNILQNKKLAAQFTPAEKAALRSVTHGSPTQQIVNLLGGGLGQLGSIGGGAAVGGLPGMLIGTALAAGQRKLSEALTERAAETARAAIASGALRTPEIAQLLAISGQRPELITNSVLGSLLNTSQRNRQPQP